MPPWIYLVIRGHNHSIFQFVIHYENKLKHSHKIFSLYVVPFMTTYKEKTSEGHSLFYMAVTYPAIRGQ